MDGIPEENLGQLIRQFLYEFKSLIYEDELLVIEREINKKALLELGLTKKQQEEIVLSLSVVHYCMGPKKDEYKPGYYWVFGSQIDGIEIYI